jgi:hypothetical protein
MNTFYHFEGRIYETLEEVTKATKNYTTKKYDEIETEKSFDEFDTEFDKLRAEGNSIADSIEWAK